jgi:HlyD family secretion protein
VEQVHVRVGDAVQMGDVLLKLATADLQLNVANAQQTLLMREANLASLQETASGADMAAAAAAVASAQANLDDLLAGPSAEEIAIAEANLRSAEASVLSSSADLGSAQNTIKVSQIEAAQAALLSAQMSQDRAQEINEDNPTQQTHEALQQANQALADAQARLDDLLAGPDTAVSANSLSAANARLKGSEADLNVALSGTSAAQIASAEAQLAQAQASLADLMEGATTQQIQTAEAEIEQARISLADAEEALAKATLVAPFAGIVTAVNVSEGEFASGVAIQLVDHNSLEVILEVDEVDIGELSIGQAATINLETWPEAEIASEVVSIAPIANTDPGSALVTYEVHLSLGETDLPVRVGMTANANLITAQFEDVLLVPNRAIKVDRAAGEYSVLLLTTDADGTQTSTEVPITIGLRDGENTQVTDGLQAGDELLIESSVPSLDFTPPGFNAGD